jgi:hypothetical protein
MAVDTTPKLNVRQTLLAKIETTTGTAIALAAGDGQMNVYNVQHSYDIPMEARPGQAGYSKLESVAGTQYASIEFDCDLTGGGASATYPAFATTLLLACGFGQASNVFSLGYQSSQPTLTMGCYIDGVKFAIAGAAGTVKFPLRAGFPCKTMHFKFMGKVVADSDVALVTPTAFNVLPPRFAGNTLSIAGSYTPYISQIEIDVNNTLQLRPYQADSTGASACYIVDRTPQITLDPELQLVATRDWLTKLTGYTTESLSVAVGTSAQNIITFASTYAQWLDVGLGDRNGYKTRQVKGQLCRDSFSITFT